MSGQSMATLLADANIVLEPFVVSVGKEVRGKSSTYRMGLHFDGGIVVYNWRIEDGKPGHLIRKILRDVANGGMVSLLTSCSYTKRAIMDGLSSRISQITCMRMDEVMAEKCPDVWPKARRTLAEASKK